MWPVFKNAFEAVLIIFVLVLVLLTVITGGDELKYGELPDCGQREVTKSKRLVFVSTLDGAVSALNIDNGGVKEWTIPTGPGKMLSSSIHKLELTNHGQWVRMIPSLNGGLYTFDGENIRPIPINADKLLQSSFRYSDELVISGGKDSRTYGIDPHSGQILYECTVNKCDNLTSPNEIVGDVILIQRQTQTVRAVEPRTGIERWNFSVGQHDLKLVEDPSADCHNSGSVDSGSDVRLKVIVPDGLVCAVSTSKPSKVLWQHKFDYPVVSAWQLTGGHLQWVDLLGGVASPALPYSPLLYVGMHNKQLYIQESVVLQKKYLDMMSASNRSPPQTNLLPSIPWKPVPASSNAGIAGSNEPILQITDETSPSTTAISVLYASEYVNGNGFFLYSPEGKTACDKINISDIHEEEEGAVISFGKYDEENTHHVEFIIQHINHSIWHWWKEIILITLPTALLINILCFKKFPLWSKVEEAITKVEVEEGMCEPAVEEEQPVELTQCYSSRYLADFEPLSCLGKGGFGVVFQARNKIDDCHYAIKRIPLPNREESRERVMREVKALAKLDHQNIVRFFNAWLECPPPRWQEEQDALLANKFQRDMCSGECGAVVDLTGHVTPISENKSFTSTSGIGRKKNILSSLWDKATSFYSSIHRLEKTVESEHIRLSNEDDSSFIVFENSNKENTAENAVTSNNVSLRPQTLSLSTNNNVNYRRRHGHSEETNHNPHSAKMFLYIQMQLCKKESLRHWLLNPDRDNSKSLQIFDQILQAVEYVHLQGLIHRDLKPSNIFFSPEGQIKVGDFGLVTAMVENCSDDIFLSPQRQGSFIDGHGHTAMVGTQLYMSPEQLAGEPYNYKVDIYSLGLILYEILVPFTTQMERCDALTKVRALKFPEKFRRDFQKEHNLLEIMLSKQPEKRPTTIGVRSRPPLRALQMENSINEDWHFSLPIRQRDPSFSRSSTSSHDS